MKRVWYLHDLLYRCVGLTQSHDRHEGRQITGEKHRHHEAAQHQPRRHHLNETQSLLHSLPDAYNEGIPSLRQ